MMRNKAESSMRKTYDECYLICSTAVYFEGQVRSLVTTSFPLRILICTRRTMNQKLYVHGDRLSIGYTITMPIEFLQTFDLEPKRKKLYKIRCGTWNYNARSGSLY